jgi:hypothetical protein
MLSLGNNKFLKTGCSGIRRRTFFPATAKKQEQAEACKKDGVFHEAFGLVAKIKEEAVKQNAGLKFFGGIRNLPYSSPIGRHPVFLNA